jgi:predicted RNA-binding protein YlxR (DUF448 family)
MSATQTLDRTDNGRTRRQDAGSERRCIVSNTTKPPAELLRFVIGPDNSVVPDISGRLPGRGIWLSADRISINTACDRKLFNRAARQPVIVGEGLADRVESLLVRQCTDLLGLARRAGQAVSGFVKVRDWLQNRRAVLVFAATDGAVGSREKLRWAARDIPVVSVLDATELGLAFGRDRTVHVAVASGGLADRLAVEAARLSGFRQLPENEESDE